MATAHPTSTPSIAVRPRRRALAPLEPVRAQSRWLLGIGFFILFFSAWAFFTQHYGIVPICIFAFIAAHAIGQGTVIWVLISEMCTKPSMPSPT